MVKNFLCLPANICTVGYREFISCISEERLKKFKNMLRMTDFAK